MSKIVENFKRELSEYILEKKESWLYKRVKNPVTGNEVYVRSLPKKIRDKYKPHKEKRPDEPVHSVEKPSKTGDYRSFDGMKNFLDKEIKTKNVKALDKRVFLVNDDKGDNFIFKTTTGKGAGGNSLRAKQFLDELGWGHLTPGIGMAKLKNKVGTIQEFAKGIVLGRTSKHSPDVEERLKKINGDDVVRSALLDALTLERGRHEDNVMIDKDGSISLIDNEESFRFPKNAASLFWGDRYQYRKGKIRTDLDKDMDMLHYQTHTKGPIGTNYPKEFKSLLQKLDGMSAEDLRKNYRFDSKDIAGKFKDHVHRLLNDGLEKTIGIPIKKGSEVKVPQKDEEPKKVEVKKEGSLKSFHEKIKSIKPKSVTPIGVGSATPSYFIDTDHGKMVFKLTKEKEKIDNSVRLNSVVDEIGWNDITPLVGQGSLDGSVNITKRKRDKFGNQVLDTDVPPKSVKNPSGLFSQLASGISLGRGSVWAKDAGDRLKKINGEHVIRGALLDVLTMQNDRHEDNVMIDKDGNLQLIDHDKGFNPKRKISSVFIGTMKTAKGKDVSMLHYKKHVPGGKIGTNYPKEFKGFLDKVNKMSHDEVRSSFNFSDLDQAKSFKDHVNNMLVNGFEKAANIKD